MRFELNAYKLQRSESEVQVPSNVHRSTPGLLVIHTEDSARRIYNNNRFKTSENSNNQLPSGIYLIWTSNHEALMAPYHSLDSDKAFITTEDTLPFQWDVRFDKGKQLYTIQVHKQKSYIVPYGKGFILADEPQFFDIRHADGDFYQICTTDHHLAQHHDDKQPNKVTSVSGSESNTSTASLLWVFGELDDDIPQGPYSIYSKNSDYFEYSRKTKLLPRFGLKDESQDRWQNLKNLIRRLNADANGSVIYKLIFLGRHGHAFNNLDSKDKKEISDDNGDLEWDPALTQDGYLQVTDVHDMWMTESSLPNGGIGVPEISYCSPLTRCMVTNSITFSKQLEAGSINTVVVENCREFIYKSEGERRRTASYISLVFPRFSLEPGFAQGADPLWNKHQSETAKSADLRARAVVDRIFKSEPKEKIFVSITAHHDINGAIISALGGNPAFYPRYNGGIVPLICQYTPPAGPLEDGFYMIDFVPNPPLFADAVGVDKPVMALDKKAFKPTTWFVKQTHGMPKPKLYWNRGYQDHSSQTSDVLVILSYNPCGWYLIPSKEFGVYYITTPPTSSSSVGLVTVGSSSKSDGKPLVLKEASNIGSGSPSWRFIAVDFPWI